MQKTHEPRKLTVGVEIFQKTKAFVDVKAKYLLLEIRTLDVEIRLRRLGDVARGTEMVFIG